MMRRAAAILLALLAAAALPAAKPVPPGDAPVQDDAQERWRGRGISVCVAELRALPDLGPDDLESICGCAFDRFAQAGGTTPPPPVERGAMPASLRGPLIACTARTRPDRAGDVARLVTVRPQTIAPTPPPAAEAPLDAKPADEDGDTAPAESQESGEAGGGFRDWVSTLSLPAWLTGASVLWWIAIGIFVFGLLILKVRGRDPRKDLSAPPSYMRRGTPPPPPRRPDLPR